MILATLFDPSLRDVAKKAASPDEDLFWRESRVLDALERGFPRLVLRGPGGPEPVPFQAAGFGREVPVLHLTRSRLDAWDEARRAHEVPPHRATYLERRLRHAIRRSASGVPWIDGAFRDLTRALGRRLPRGVRGLGRRVMEYPAFYRTLRPLAKATGFSRGSLKARFRRRNLESPSTYLRWFRALAVVHVLAELKLPYRLAAYRLGFSGSANLCRFLENTTGLTSAQLTEAQGRERMLARFVSTLFRRRDLAGWEDLDEVFLIRVA